MKDFKEMAENVFRIRDEILEKQKIRNKKLKKITQFTSIGAAGAAVIIAAFNITPKIDDNKIEVSPQYTDAITIPTLTKTEKTTVDTTALKAKNTKKSSETKQSEITFKNTSEVETGSSLNSQQAVKTQKSTIINKKHTTAPVTENPKKTTLKSTSVRPKTTTSVSEHTYKTTTFVSETQPEKTVTTVSTQDEAVIEPKWDDKTISEQFPEFTANNGSIYGLRGCTLDSSMTGGNLYTAKLWGYDTYTEKKYEVNADVYEIYGISSECSVALKFNGNDNYYVYFNRNYFPENLGELAASLGLYNNLSVGNIRMGDLTVSDDYSQSAVLEILFSNSSATLCDSAVGETAVSMSATAGLIGINNKSIKLTADGYLTTNIMEWGYTFYVGQDTVSRLIEYLNSFNLSGPTTTPSEDIPIVEE